MADTEETKAENENKEHTAAAEALSGSVHSANAWEKADFEDSDRKQKFLRLMGAAKVHLMLQKEHHGRFIIGDNKTGNICKDDVVQKMNTDLEKQYNDSLQIKLGGGRKRGLGFSDPPKPEVAAEQSEAGGGQPPQEGAVTEQQERDRQMRPDRDRDGDSRDEHGRDEREGRHFEPRRDDYRDRRDDRWSQGSRDRADYRGSRPDNRDRGHQWGSGNYRGTGGYQGNEGQANTGGYQGGQGSSGYQSYSGYQGNHGYQTLSYQGNYQSYGQQGYQGHSRGNQYYQGNSGGHRGGRGFRPGFGQGTNYSANQQTGCSAQDSSAQVQHTSSHSTDTSQPQEDRKKYQMAFVKSTD